MNGCEEKKEMACCGARSLSSIRCGIWNRDRTISLQSYSTHHQLWINNYGIKNRCMVECLLTKRRLYNDHEALRMRENKGLER